MVYSIRIGKCPAAPGTCQARVVAQEVAFLGGSEKELLRVEGKDEAEVLGALSQIAEGTKEGFRNIIKE